MVCARCGHANQPDARFCSSCGASLEAPSDENTQTLHAVEAADAEDELATYLEGLPPGVGLLVVRHGPNAGSSFRLDAEHTNVGRHPDSEIFLDDVTVSRRHVVIDRNEGGYVLRDVGSWLKVNGDAIYGARPWNIFGEGPTQVVEGSFNDTNTHPYTPEDFRFTTKGDSLYAIELGWPSKPEALIHSLKTPAAGERPVESVELVGFDGKVQFKQQDDGLHIQLPERNPGKYAYVYKIAFLGN